MKLVFVDFFPVLFFNAALAVMHYLYKKMCLKQPPVFTLDSSVSTVTLHTVHVVGNSRTISIHLGSEVTKLDPRVSWKSRSQFVIEVWERDQSRAIWWIDHCSSMDDQGLETTARRTRNIGSRVCHCLLIVPLLAVVVLASVSLGIFVAKKNEINGNTIFKDEQHGSCILYATYKGPYGDIFDLHLSSEIACNLSIWGEGALAVLGALLAVGMIIKAVAGVYV